MLLFSIFTALLGLGFGGFSWADPALVPEVKLIGENYVFSTERPVPVLPDEHCLPQGKALGAIKVRVVGESAEIIGVKLDYGSGVFDEFRVGEKLKQGQSTDWLNLKTSMQCVERVDIAVQKPKTAPTDVPVVQVWGLVGDRVGK